MTLTERRISAGIVICSDGTKKEILYCRMCRHARWFIVNGKQVKSPSLAYCMKERADNADITKATIVGCAENCGDGFSSIANIIS